MTVNSVTPLAYDDLCPICGATMTYHVGYYFDKYDAWICDSAIGCGYKKIVL